MATLLIVDDDKFMRHLMRETLSEQGHTVLEAGDAEDALVFSDHVDLILLDHYLPGMNGAEATALFHEKGIPLLLVSGSAELDVLKLALQSGALGYITKPFSPEQLILHVETALARVQEYVALNQRLVVNLAVGLIMERMRLVREEAETLLVNSAESKQISLEQAANEIVSWAQSLNSELGGGGPLSHSD